MDINVATCRQAEIGDEINKININFKKDSSSRKTLEYIQKRKTSIQKLWAEFDLKHKQLIAVIQEEHKYIKNDYYGQVQNEFTELNDQLSQLELALNKKESQLQIPIQRLVSTPDVSPSYNLQTQTNIETNDTVADGFIRRQAVRYNSIRKLINDSRSKLVHDHPKSFWMFTINSISDQWSAIRSLREDIIELDCPRTKSYCDEEVYDNLYDEVQRIIVEIHHHLEKCDVSLSGNDKIHLPPINIPTFDGNYQTWTAFQDIFSKFVHNNKRLSPVEKMQYLKTSLKGEASKLLSHLYISNDNYDTAWEMLNNRFNNKRILVTTHISRIFNLPKVSQAVASEIKHIHDSTIESLHAIKNLGIGTDSWGPLIIHILQEKLDKDTLKLYEQSLTEPKEIPTLKQLMNVLENRFQSLEIVRSQNKCTEGGSKKEFGKKDQTSAKTYHSKSAKCSICHEGHWIFSCQKFIDMSIAERNAAITKLKLCYNCLLHPKEINCKSTKLCSKCNKKHNTLLHRERKEEASASTNIAKTKSPYKSTIDNPEEVLLATAMIKIKKYDATWEFMRVLIDQGSQASFITMDAAETLGLPRSKAKVQVSGMGNTGAGSATSKIMVEVKARFSSNFKLQCDLLILKRLTSALPCETPSDINLSELNNCLLADPTYDTPGPIDILIGADIFPLIIKDGIKKTQDGYLAQNTEFGWIISGKTKQFSDKQKKIVSMISTTDESAQLTKFWELEEIQTARKWSKDDQECEEFYNATTFRENSKYVVKLPFKQATSELGESRKRAVARLLQIERKFEKDQTFKQEYQQFMREYEYLGHMVPVRKTRHDAYYIPHHGVVKEDSTTTKLRVVFDASARTSTGKCLNELMHVGPRLQEDLPQILLRWRKHKVALSADIEKMYRQITIDETDQPYQTILWRRSPNDPIQEFQLTTVTYGTSSAPFLAVRTLQQLALDEETNHEKAATVACNDFYVDDLITGCDSIEEATYLQAEIIKLLQKGSFKLRKWKSNKRELITTLPNDLQEKNFLELEEDETRKTLGVHWAPIIDGFKYKTQLVGEKRHTKRSILSNIARLYDPLGWLAPIIIKAKLLIQNLWVNENKWDDPVPPEIETKWIQFLENLPNVEQLVIPRWINYDGTCKFVELHGFCDASEKAYGAAVYSRVTLANGDVSITLLTAKSKVAPIKMKKTLPRLELCGAVLVAKLLRQSEEALKITDIKTYAWTDSMITLAWIKGNPDRWKSFVSNRVIEILENTDSTNWGYVKSEENPADLVSRGVAPELLHQKLLWWKGPEWLSYHQLPNTSTNIPPTKEEEKRKLLSYVAIHENKDIDIIERYSSFRKLIRVVAYCLRFASRCKKIKHPTHLPVGELRIAHERVILVSQSIHLVAVRQALQSGLTTTLKFGLSTLQPFIDERGLIRVGGRLQHSHLNYEEKHPLFIPHDSNLSKLIIQDAHMQTLHGGNQLTLSLVRKKYWIVRAKPLVRQCIRKCMICFRLQASTAKQVMGDLPARRVNISAPFSHTGVDYAGPIQLRMTKGRGNKSYKGYIALFVCMATKAIHIEAVSDMTTEAFLAAFRRFQARRGHCSHIYSDNGTNFVGAKRILAKEIQLALKQPAFLQILASDGIEWHFSPPSAPHFGGLWEAGVKSTKHHLTRIIGQNTLTFEELSTVLCQIEACLNSRPLCALTEEVGGDNVLTPGHFLIGRALISPPDTTDLTDEAPTTTRWKLLQKMKRDFWKVWSSEYLHYLQQRYKWQNATTNLAPGNMVLVKDDNTTPTKWPLARIMEIHPGSDGKVRVVTVKTQHGAEFKRPIVKLCPLPIEDNVLLNENDNPPRTPRKKPTNIATLTTILLSLLCLATQGQAASYLLKTPPPGAYIEHIGEALLHRGRLRIDVPINGTMIGLHQDLANKTIHQFELVCKASLQVTNKVYCKNQVDELHLRFDDLKQQINIIQNGYDTRKKRGLLGQVMTSIFGVNDEVYTDIAKLDKNQKQLIQTSHQQTTIMIKTLASLNLTEARIALKLNQFTEKLNHGLAEIGALDNWYKITDENKINIHVLAIYQLAQELLREMEITYSKLLKVVHHQGILNDFISPSEFKRVMSNVTSQLPSALQVWANHTVEINMKYNQGNIMICGYFYIIEKPKYTLISVTAIPQRLKGDIFTAITIKYPLLAIDYDNGRYFELEHLALNNNVKLAKNLFLCSPDVIQDMNKAPNCIIDIIYSRSKNTTCGHQTFQVSEQMWKHLYLPNTWLFITNQPTRVSLKCNGQLEDVWLNNTGIIQINQTCTLDTGTGLLKTRTITHIQATSAFHKPINTTSTTVHRPKKQSKPIPVFAAHEDFGKLLHDEELLHEDQQSMTWSSIGSHITSSIPGVIITLVIIAAIVAVRYYQRPRRATTPDFMLTRQNVQSIELEQKEALMN